MNLREELHAAANKFDGHVTNGSIIEQEKVVRAYLDEFVNFLKGELKTAGDFGMFEMEVSEDFPAYPEYIAIETIKKARDKWLAI